MNAANVGDAPKKNFIQGMITVYDTPVALLFDSGHIHSYMSYRLDRDLVLKPRILDPPMNVSCPKGNQILVDKQIRPVLIQVHNKSTV